MCIFKLTHKQPRTHLNGQVDPEQVADQEDDTDGNQDDGQVHLAVAVAGVDLRAGPADTPATQK